MFGVASVAGPVIGGFFAGMDSLLGLSGWRWGFLINLPIGLVALVVVWRLFDLPHRRTDQRVDYAGAGAVALTLTLVPLLIAADRGREWGWAPPVPC